MSGARSLMTFARVQAGASGRNLNSPIQMSSETNVKTVFGAADGLTA